MTSWRWWELWLMYEVNVVGGGGVGMQENTDKSIS